MTVVRGRADEGAENGGYANRELFALVGLRN
jgi:hypothetical protein